METNARMVDFNSTIAIVILNLSGQTPQLKSRNCLTGEKASAVCKKGKVTG